ncbi:MAG: hypothetical protein GF390_00470, partial [Candidatus Pacebacteria bacterium]|nr:hypothetical protein [Candidatus Paceibacterota bacterium]
MNIKQWKFIVSFLTKLSDFLSSMLKTLNNHKKTELLVKNFLPLIGIIFFDWNLTFIFLMIWVGNGVENFFIALKSIFVKDVSKGSSIFFKLLNFFGYTLLNIFFLSIYGAFSFVNTLIIMVLSYTDPPDIHEVIQAATNPLLQYIFILVILEIVILIRHYLINNSSKRQGCKSLEIDFFTKNIVLHISIIIFMFMSAAIGVI